MRHIAVLLTLTAGLLASGPAPALAQSAASASAAAPAGADGVLLQKALEANAQGNCPADLMAADLISRLNGALGEEAITALRCRTG